MKVILLLMAPLLLARSGAGCVGTVGPDDAGPQDGGGGGTWFTTCGDPVCQGYTLTDAGFIRCTGQIAGQSCPILGEECDPWDNCNALLRCATSDPKQQVGGCPIS